MWFKDHTHYIRESKFERKQKWKKHTALQVGINTVQGNIIQRNTRTSNVSRRHVERYKSDCSGVYRGWKFIEEYFVWLKINRRVQLRFKFTAEYFAAGDYLKLFRAVTLQLSSNCSSIHSRLKFTRRRRNTVLNVWLRLRDGKRLDPSFIKSAVGYPHI